MPDIDKSLAMYNDQIRSAFSSRWAGKHKCKKTGETNVNPLKKLLSIDRVSKSFGD